MILEVKTHAQFIALWVALERFVADTDEVELSDLEREWKAAAIAYLDQIEVGVAPLVA